MDILIQLFTSLVSDQNQAEKTVIGLIVLIVFLLTLSILLFLSNLFDPVRARFLNENIRENRTSPQGFENATKSLQTYSHVILPSNEELANRTKQRLHYAGYHAKKHLLQYFAIRLFLVVALPLVTLVIITVIPAAKVDWLLNGVIISFAAGFVLPSFILDKKIAKRQKTIQRAFPDALDMLIICSEAGLSLDSSIQKVTTELRFNQPILADELSLVVSEIQAGVDRKAAMKGLADRTGVKEIKGLMSTLTQCMIFGTSVTEALRVYAEDLRDRRLQAAQEKAAKIGAKLVFPLGLCLLPAFILIVMAPVFLSLMKAMPQ